LRRLRCVAQACCACVCVHAFRDQAAREHALTRRRVAAAQPAAAEGATLGKRKAEEEAGAEAEGEEEEAGAGAKEAPAPFEPLHLGPKTFTSAELCFRYFSSLLATQTMHQDCNQARELPAAASSVASPGLGLLRRAHVHARVADAASPRAV
jgi:hypothetical protein